MSPSSDDQCDSDKQLPVEWSVYQLKISPAEIAMDSETAREAIAKLQQLQNEQLEVLKGLFNVAGAEPVAENNQSDGAAVDASGCDEDDAEKNYGGDAFNPFPHYWDMAWDDGALENGVRHILDELKSLGSEGKNTVSDTAIAFIEKNVLKNLDGLHFHRIPDPKTGVIPLTNRGPLMDGGEWEDTEAFHVRDFRRVAPEKRTGMTAVSRYRDDIETSNSKLMDSQHLKQPRSETHAHGREIDVQAITPSSLAMVLMSEGYGIKEEKYGRLFDATALARHLSNDSRDRFFQYNCYVFSGSPGHGNCITKTWWSTTLSYFAVYDRKPCADSAPLVDAGIFNSTFPKISAGDRYIREEKFTVNFSSHRRWVVEGDHLEYSGSRFKNSMEHGPWQLLTFNAPQPRYFARYPLGDTDFLEMMWYNLEHIQQSWINVMDELDRQISVPSAVIFDPELRGSILFEDEEFSNSKRYFWALQSLRVFTETIDLTIGHMPKMFEYPHLLGNFTEGSGAKIRDAWTENFVSLRERIERKRSEIQGLSDGLFAASSVVEARLAANQNANIRLLTLVTIAFLPVSLVTALFSMQVLPESATLSSFAVTAVVVSLITFLTVFNLRNASRILRMSYGNWTKELQESMLADPRKGWSDRGNRLRSAEQFRRGRRPVSNWWYLSYLPAYLSRVLPFKRREIAGDQKRVEESLA